MPEKIAVIIPSQTGPLRSTPSCQLRLFLFYDKSDELDLGP